MKKLSPIDNEIKSKRPTTTKAVAGWVLSGHPMNWKIAIEEKKWAVREQYKKLWDALNQGDLLIFYVIRPISGVVGFGKVLEKLVEDYPLWPDEKNTDKVIYRLRWKIDPIYFIPYDRWLYERLPIRDSRLVYFRGTNACWSQEAVHDLLRHAEDKWKTNLCIFYKEKP
mgnify:CR=1 FL=1